jgi:L-fuculose-phosphate aldolase
MNALGINQGTSGNISVRHGGTMLISPSAVPYEQMSPDQIAAMPIDGDHGAWDGPLPPSTEWRMHLGILRSRPEMGAVVHGHPTFATALAITRGEIPACHYMIAAFGGTTVRCAPYATYGTQELAEYTLAALEGRNGCLLANHGMVVCGPTLARAMWLAVELEALARQYYHSLLIGGPVLLSDAAVAATAEKLGSYGLREEPQATPESSARREAVVSRSAVGRARPGPTMRKPPKAVAGGEAAARRRRSRDTEIR